MTIDEVVSDNPIINIFRDVKNTMIDLTFLNVTDYEFTNLVTRLQTFTAEGLFKREDAVPSIMVTLAPKEFEGRFYVSALHGMWVLMPSVVGGAVDTVRFVFENEFVNCFEAEEGMNEGVDFFGSAAG